MAIKEVKTQYNPKEIEASKRKLWDEHKIPQKLAKKGKEKFYLLDGPPYVNQIAHIGHVKTTTVKDIWSKFKLMQGFQVWLQPGFDCHGLPIENMVERELNIKSKKDIEEMGVEKFIEACRKHAEGNEHKWLELYKKLGAWRGWFDPYLTFRNYYIESGWWTTKKMFERGMLTRGEKSIYWCPHCSTALSGYEVTDSYADVKDPSIFVKFPIRGKSNEYIVIWTTTPWTLISNVAIAAHPDEYYVRVKVGKDILIMAEKRVEAVLRDLCKVEYEIQEKFLGKRLEGVKYDPVFSVPIQEELKKNPNAHRIILSLPVMKKESKVYTKQLVKKGSKKSKEEFIEFVTMDEGSGCVHTAPGHGPEDYTVGLHYNLPMASPLDDEGKFTKEAGEFKGIFVKDADKLIAEKLEKRGLLLHFGWSTHAYPLCWRCKSPLVFRLSKQWFFKVDTIKNKMLKENEKIRWLPDFGRERFRNWLMNATDWCISQQRYWGIPLPVWICEKCQSMEVMGSVEELRKKSVKKLSKEFDLHKHVVDKIDLVCSNCKGMMKRVPDTMNVWFDSGISPWASFGYPYMNKELFEKMWPVDLICESQDQIRGWFYSLTFCGVSVFDKNSYGSCSLMGWVLDEKGEKMSKSLGNVIWADEGLEKLGADILRLYYCWEVAPWEVQKFSIKTAEEVKRAINILWNSYSFFTTYCTDDFKPTLKNLEQADKWILSKVNSLVSEVTNHLENFEFHFAGRKLMDFVFNDLSRFYIKIIRDRVWVSEAGKSKQAALSTLHEVLVTLSKLFAPITPFISEEIYSNLVCSLDPKAEPSIHLCEWPIANKKFADRKLEEEVEIAKKIIEASLAARQAAGIKLRWPIKQVVVVIENKKVVESVNDLQNILAIMCNAKSVSSLKVKPSGNFSEVETDVGKILIDKKLDDKLVEEALVREVAREIQSLRKKNKFNVKQNILLTLNSDEQTNKILKKHFNDLKEEVGASKISVGKLEGKYKGSVEFEGKRVSIQFDGD